MYCVVLLDFVSGKRNRDDFLVVAGVNGSICEGGMRPDDQPARITIHRVEKMRPANLLVFLRRPMRDDEVREVIEKKTAAPVFDDGNVSPAGRFSGRWLEGL